MRLDYSPIYAGFAYKTTESLWHWCALLRCIVCSDDDAVLVHAELLVLVRCCGSWAKLCARELHKLVRRYARIVRTAVVRSGNECVRLPSERRGAMLCSEPPATVWTSVANCCHLRAGCCRTVCVDWCKTSGRCSPNRKSINNRSGGRAFDLAGITKTVGCPVLRVFCEGRESEMPAHI